MGEEEEMVERRESGGKRGQGSGTPLIQFPELTPLTVNLGFLNLVSMVRRGNAPSIPLLAPLGLCGVPALWLLVTISFGCFLSAISLMATPERVRGLPSNA